MHWMKLKAACVVGVLVLAVVPVGAKTIYVDDDANGLNNGTSWSNAYRFLLDALTEAKTAEKPIEIRVAQGVYQPDPDFAHPQGGVKYLFFELYDEMSLLGGYGGVRVLDPNSRDFTAYPTILSGDLLGNDVPVTDLAKLRYEPTRADNSPVLWMRRYNKGHMKLEGCLITGGSNTALVVQSPADAIDDPDLKITDCTFRGNIGSWGRGGDVIVPAAVGTLGNSRLTIARCAFIENASGGGALSCRGVISNCEFTRNYAWYPIGNGAAAFLGESTIVDCTFTEEDGLRVVEAH